jgi:CheY-like chemotaxis protein
VEPPARRGQVMIVDDEPQLAWAMKRLLDAEHDVVAVTHGREALDRMLAGERFDVIVCDLTMPYMTGEELYHEIETRFGVAVAARILFVTGGALSEEGSAFLQGVQNPRLYKPFDPAELRGQIRRVMAITETVARN